MNLLRVPLCGRNFEYTVGEDPYLGYVLVKQLVKGIQDQQVIACAKHWVLNSQEINRDTVSENPLDDRTMFEMYYPPFEGAVEAGVGSFMCSYNKIHDAWSCENPTTLAGHLKKDLNFTGWVMSDWGATHSTSIIQGLDQEMPGADYFGDTLLQAIKSGQIDPKYADDSVYRILLPMFQMGIFDNPNPNFIYNNVTNDKHVEVAKNLSAKSTILLKNQDNILPLQMDTISNIGVFGKAADEEVIFAGDGSGTVVPAYVVSPFWGIRDRLGFPRPTTEQPYQDCYNNKCVYYNNGSDLDAAAALAAMCDVVIIDVAVKSGEGSDRPNLSFGD